MSVDLGLRDPEPPPPPKQKPAPRNLTGTSVFFFTSRILVLTTIPPVDRLPSPRKRLCPPGKLIWTPAATPMRIPIGSSTCFFFQRSFLLTIVHCISSLEHSTRHLRRLEAPRRIPARRSTRLMEDLSSQFVFFFIFVISFHSFLQLTIQHF